MTNRRDLCRNVTLLMPALMTVLLVATIATADEKPKLKSVAARGITLQVPASWKNVKTTSKFRAAQFAISAKQAGDEGADLVVYHFGGGATGGIKSNVTRWVGQFHKNGRKVELSQGKSKLGEYVVSEVSGTWKKPDGPPFARKTIDKPGSRVIGVILIAKTDNKDDYYFLKLSGPDALVKSQAADLRAAFGYNIKSEKPLKLEDAKN